TPTRNLAPDTGLGHQIGRLKVRRLKSPPTFMREDMNFQSTPNQVFSDDLGVIADTPLVRRIFAGNEQHTHRWVSARRCQPPGGLLALQANIAQIDHITTLVVLPEDEA